MVSTPGDGRGKWQRGGDYPGITPLKGEGGAAAQLGVHYNTVKELLAARGLGLVHRRGVAYVKDQHLLLLLEDRRKAALPNECTILEAADILFARSDELKEVEKTRLDFLRKGVWPPPKIEKRYQKLLHSHYGKAHNLVKTGKLAPIRETSNGDHTRMVFYRTHLKGRLIEATKCWACILLDRNDVYALKKKGVYPKPSNLPAHHKNETEIARELGVPEKKVHGPLAKIRKKHGKTDKPIAQIGHHTDSLGRMQPRWYWDTQRTYPELEAMKAAAAAAFAAAAEKGRQRILDALRKLDASREPVTQDRLISAVKMSQRRVKSLVADLVSAGLIEKVMAPSKVGKWGGERLRDRIRLAESPCQPAQEANSNSAANGNAQQAGTPNGGTATDTVPGVRGRKTDPRSQRRNEICYDIYEVRKLSKREGLEQAAREMALEGLADIAPKQWSHLRLYAKEWARKNGFVLTRLSAENATK